MENVDEANFEAVVLKADKLVLVDFYGVWCPPCRALAPVLEKLSKELTEVSIVKVNVDENASLSEKYGISAIPTLIFFKNGESVHKLQGLQSEAALKEAISAL